MTANTDATPDNGLPPQGNPRISRADLEARAGWTDDAPQTAAYAAPLVPHGMPTFPRGQCLACGTVGQHRYMRKVFSTGAGFHIMAVCDGCHCNARGAGQWVSRIEVADMGWTAEALPEHDSGQGVLL